MSLIFKKDTHQYFLNNKELFSVSKILDNYLGSNYDKIPKAKLEKAIIRGNCVHKVAELYFKYKNNQNVVNEIKTKIKNKSVFTEKILEYCFTLLDFLEQKFKKDKEYYISEQMYYADIVAGTPDLIFKTELDLYSIIDFKTYKVMTKELKEKATLQLTAYYWLLKQNGFKLTNTHYIIWINENKLQTISIKITKEKLHEWEMAMFLWKENWNGINNIT
ncbi:PD-(D/E)XK nuclease family protein [Spiroplasma endosymbiont of Dasysyrphus albostriatus]|uniref:PD-(D/E)XK nuclease family protein n=1 Tax=Spiroplasma endosymbiont of Dasysyrphus albostriatus TaxID=3066299 RepID=UPI0030CB1F07